MQAIAFILYKTVQAIALDEMILFWGKEKSMILIHETTREYIYAVKRNQIQIRTQIVADKSADCKIVYWNRFFEDIRYEKEMECVGSDGLYSYYESDLKFEDTAQYLRYYFKVTENNKVTYWGRDGMGAQEPEYYFEYLATAEDDIVTVPNWAEGTVWYQIFPERYYNGDQTNDPKDVQPWGAVPTRENHFGGDILGIMEKLPYLQELGIEVLYLTPVFASPSNHKYDTTDYFKIDPSFGTENDLIQLVQQCHMNGIKVILDGVFNHIGYSSAQFQDVIKNGVASEYANWFYIKNFPIQTEPLNYECVGYYKWMPKLRYSTRAVRDYIISVGKYWIKKANIDGWRLDVADEVDFTFWQEFRRAIKSIKPDAFLLAETWKDGRDMLRGDQMDSIMNYLFRDAVVDFFAKKAIDVEVFANRISKMLYGYSKVSRPVLYNAIGSHDTPRFLTLCNGDKKRMKLAVAFQMTFSGMPAVYYGDEIGMDGENDPDCRKTMDWENEDIELLDLYRWLIKLRKESSSLRFGNVKIVYAHDDVIAYLRQYKEEVTCVAINNSEHKVSIHIPCLENLKTLEDISDVEMNPFQFKIFTVK